MKVAPGLIPAGKHIIANIFVQNLFLEFIKLNKYDLRDLKFSFAIFSKNIFLSQIN